LLVIPNQTIRTTGIARVSGARGNRWLRDADAFVAMSRAIRDEMLGAGIPGERIVLLPHGVDTERFSPATAEEKLALRRELGLPEGVLAVYSGRLLRGKGLETLLDAFAAIADRAAGLGLVLIGSGEGQALSIEDELRRRVAERGLGTRVAFAGRSERVEDFLRAADVFVFPSVFEALGIALVEAAACGLPAVASRTGGIVMSLGATYPVSAANTARPTSTSSANAARSAGQPAASQAARPSTGAAPTASTRGYNQPNANAATASERSGTKSSAFSGYQNGGAEKQASERGQRSASSSGRSASTRSGGRSKK